MNKVPITEAEKMSPYYKYFVRDLTPIPEEKQQLLKHSLLTPENATKVQDMNDLFKEGYLPGENGWTRMKDGTLALANLTDMPGVTVEMIDWWFAWHCLEPMRYKIWDPEDHYYCLTRNPEKARDKSLPMRERIWDTIHDIEEDATGSDLLGHPENAKKDKIAMRIRRPQDIGFDEEKLKKFNGTITASADEKHPVVMCHFVRPTDRGCEVRSRFWIGCCVKNGKPQKIKFPPARIFPEKAVHGLLAHCIKEMTHLAKILPELYAEFGPEIE